MAGRRPKPTAVKALAGNPGKRPLPKSEPRPPRAGVPRPPDWLGQYGKALWRRLAEDLDRLGLLTTIDLAAFEGLCSAYHRMREAAADIKRHGRIYVKDGIERLRPACRIEAEARKELRQYAAEFGMTPAARSRVAAALGENMPKLPGAAAWPEQRDPSRPDLPTPEVFTDEHYFDDEPRRLN